MVKEENNIYRPPIRLVTGCCNPYKKGDVRNVITNGAKYGMVRSMKSHGDNV